MSDRDGFEELRHTLGAAIRERLDAIKQAEERAMGHLGAENDRGVKAAYMVKLLAESAKHLTRALHAIRPRKQR